MINWIKKELEDYKVLLRNVPALPLCFFVISVIAMNLLASKLIVDTSWIALDAGITVSWLSFLSMDMLVKRFGAKASIKLSILTAGINVVVMLLFSVAALIPGDWGLNDYASGMNWWIIGASTAAFIVAGIVNALTHKGVEKLFTNKHSYKAYVVSSYVSTMLGQFIDNLVFALIFTMPAFGLEFVPALMFALTGAVVELMCQVIFSPIGYKVATSWAKYNVGQEYLDLYHPEDAVNSNI